MQTSKGNLLTDSHITIGNDKRGRKVALALRYANRHVLVTGATGSGKSVSVMRLCSEFARHGVPVLAFDAKGDLSGLAVNLDGSARPARLFDAFGVSGERAALSFARMGADATSRALGLSFAQSGAVDVAFAATRSPINSPDDLARALHDLDASPSARAFGHVSQVSVQVIRRALLRVDRAAFEGAIFDPLGAIESTNGVGQVGIFDARRLADSGPLYGAAICQTMESLYSGLPEIGDAPLPRLALVIDEAHLLFAGIESQLLARIERIVRLIRSKGIVLIFASQLPADIPATIAAQCASRIQHALRSATPSDARAVQVAAESLVGSDSSTFRAISELKPGEAFVSLVGANGAPGNCSRVQVARPACRIGALTADERSALFGASAGAPENASVELLAAPPGELPTLIGAIAVAAIIIGAVIYVGGIWQAAIVAAFAVGLYVLRRPLLFIALVTGLHHHHSHGRHSRHR
jgi:hypothetical protein